MITLIIHENSPEAKKFIEFAKTLPFVEESIQEIASVVREMEIDYERNATKISDEDMHPVWEVSPRRMTTEEYREKAEQAIKDVREGRTISHEELKKRWKENPEKMKEDATTKGAG